MDKSLDQLIKENPKKFNLNRGKNQKRNANVGNGKAVGGVKKAGVGRNTKKNNNSSLLNVARNSGKVTKQVAGKQGVKVIKGKLKNQNNGQPVVVDARNKLLAKNRMKIVDARDRLAAIAKKTDLRQKLSSKKTGSPQRKTANQRTKIQGIQNLLTKDLGRSPLSRTIIGRTVENELARSPMSNMGLRYTQHYEPAPTQFYNTYHQPEPSYDFNRSSAAMDLDPLPISKRIRSTDQRLGPRDEPKSKADSSGYRVCVSNLHPRVTQEDIAELFGDVGTLVRASLQRPGSAEVYYLRREDALKAVDVYHNRQLDGLPMRCNLGPTYEPLRREVTSPQSKSRAPVGKGSNISPDINTIHRALFTKNSSNSSQIFTITLPKA